MHLPRLLPAVLSLVFTCQVRAADDYQLGPDSMTKPGVPAGKEEKLTLPTSRIFPGADHEADEQEHRHDRRDRQDRREPALPWRP